MYLDSAPIEMNPALEAKLKNIPSGPGVYIYKDSAGTAIYVGKSKSLRNRVRTYFQDSRNPGVRLDHMMERL
jgi:excinuclease ABC subunit C